MTTWSMGWIANNATKAAAYSTCDRQDTVAVAIDITLRTRAHGQRAQLELNVYLSRAN